MFEKFSDRLRKALALANQEAQRFNHEYIDTEHMLLGLVKEGSGIGANVLKNFEVDLRKLRLEVEKLVKSGPDMVAIGKLPQTPRAKKVIEYTIEEARNFNSKVIETSHLLLGLLREQDGVAAQVLMKLGIKLEEAREEVLNLSVAESPETPLDLPELEASMVDDSPRLTLLVDPGTATPEEIGELLCEISTLYRMLGGSGITFTKTDAREPIFT